MVLREGEKPRHSFACREQKHPSGNPEEYEQCLFLYREFKTELLRLLIPATTLDSTMVKVESFVAAFMLGMKEYFGNVEHLRATVMDVPVPEGDFRKQYLVIYDSVPGGTGYLKQLMQSENALVEVFEKALQVLENCSCRNDPQKDGCYHCLYAYRQSQQIGNISRAVAIRLLKSILSGRDQRKKVRCLNDISVNPILESELEQHFVEAVRTTIGAENVSDIIRNGKHGYYLKMGDLAWEMEPQVTLEEEDGVEVPCRPDFVFWPVRDSAHLPVAVFTDGFRYHHAIAGDDTLKREAIRRSGRFRVWSLSYRDVQSVFQTMDPFWTETLDPMKMPAGKIFYQDTLKRLHAEGLTPAKTDSFLLLMQYLEKPQAEKLFQGQATAYGCSLLEGGKAKDKAAFDAWRQEVQPVLEQTGFTEDTFTFGKTVFGTWNPGGQGGITVCAEIPLGRMEKREVAVCALLRDGGDTRSGHFEEDWNGFWRFANVMQFLPRFVGVSSTGLGQRIYEKLSVPPLEEEVPQAQPGDAWAPVLDLLLEKEAIAFARAAREAGIPAPQEDNVGLEVGDDSTGVIATLELAWPQRRIGFMTGEQGKDRARLEKLGWRILDLEDISRAAELFGGNG